MEHASTLTDVLRTDLPWSQRLDSATGQKAYASLRLKVSAAGILDRSLSFYLPIIAVSFGGYALSALAIVLLEDYLFLAIACIGFSFFSVQLAGLMHDSGHRAVFRSKILNDALGLASSSAIGMVFPNWRSRHNAHHAHPNQEHVDPDMEIPFVAIGKESFLNKDRLQRGLAKWQVFYYYPLGALVGFTNRLGSISYFLRSASPGNHWLLWLYLPGVFSLFVLPFILFPLGKAAFVFFVIHTLTGVYLASCFAPNHKGRPILPRNAGASFIEQQVVTARNVRGGMLTEFLLVGLNYQVEHHLFPTCPRNKLHLLKPFVRRACQDLGIEYSEETFIETNRLLLRQLAAAAQG